MGMKLEFQPYQSPQGWYTLQYPEYWEMEVIEGIPTFFDPQGSGAVVISAFENKTGDYNSEVEMRRFLSHHGIEYNIKNIFIFENTQGSIVQTCEFISKERFWFVYMMSYQDKLLILSYNSDEAPGKDLSTIISGIVSSIYFNVQNY
jgi:hypothetical protein